LTLKRRVEEASKARDSLMLAVISASLASIMVAVPAHQTSVSAVAVTGNASPMAWRTSCV
jgi:hypothetical protein